MKLAVVGGCQAGGIASWVRALVPNVTVQAWHVNGGNPDSQADVVFPQLVDFDFVINQLSDGSGAGVLERSSLNVGHSNVVYAPLIVFTGFHPDVGSCSIKSRNCLPLRGPLEVIHSKIILACFHMGLKEDRVAPLFNELVFASLGYLGVFEPSKKAFFNIYGAEGYNFEEKFDSWIAQGHFMYTDNHPHIRVLRDLTTQALSKLGIPFLEKEIFYPADELGGSVNFPVYPELAKHIGVKGDYLFMRSIYSMKNSENREITLQELIHDSYALLSSFRSDDFVPDSEVQRIADILSDLVI